MLSRLHEMVHDIPSLIQVYICMSHDGKIKRNLKFEKNGPTIATITPFLVINQVTYGSRSSRMDQVKFVKDIL